MFDTPDNYVNLIVALIILAAFFVYYYCNVVRPPILSCASTKFKSFLKESMPILSEKYWPTIWCYESRSISCLQYFCCARFNVPYEREILKLDDGGQIALDWLYAENECANTPTILILPGITGCSEDVYVKKYAINAYEGNFRCVVLNYRGLGGLELTTPKLYCMNDTADLEQVVNHIKDRYPNTVLAACGISMGAQMLAHYLIKYSHLQKIAFAMMNNTLYNVLCTAEKMDYGVDFYINKFIAYKLRRTVASFKHILDTKDSPWNVEEVMKTRTVQEFDEALTIKMFGFKSVQEYYNEATLQDKMDKIQVPVLCLSAADDPGQPLEYSVDNDTPLFDNDKVAVVITATGGHISHLEGLWPIYKKDSYMHRVFVQYFFAMFHNDSYKLFLPSTS